MIRRLGCLSRVELSRAATDGADANEAAHIEGCAYCQSQWRALVELKQLASFATSEAPGIEHRLLVKAELISRAHRVRPPLRGVGFTKVGFLLATSAAFASLVWWAASTPSLPIPIRIAEQVRSKAAVPVARGQVHDHGHANYVRLGSQPDEIVRLIDGAVTLQVAPLRTGERFRIVTADAEVEVRGTAFDVVAENDALKDVHVWHGRVEVRPVDGVAVVLNGGQWWRAPAQHVATGPNHKILELRSKSSRKARSSVPAMQVSGEDFEKGWMLLKQEAFDEAAMAFGREAAGKGDLAEDAAFWQAVSLARAKRLTASVESFERFLGRFPASPRVPEAQTALGWILFDAGNLDRAQGLFQSASGSASSEVSKQARAGISAIEKRKGGM